MLNSLNAQKSTGLWGPTQEIGSIEDFADYWDARPSPAKFSVPGAVKSDGWYNLTGDSVTIDDPYNPGSRVTIPKIQGTGGYPGNDMWPPIASQLGSPSGQEATLRKLENGEGGGPFAATESLYFGGMSSIPNTYGGSVAVGDSNPLAGLSTIVFQISIGEASGCDFYNGVLPMLYVNGQEIGFDATFSNKVIAAFTGVDNFPEVGEVPVYVNLYAFEWDLSEFGLDEDVNSFEIRWSAVQHAQVYYLQLDQYVSPVPEPTHYVLGMGVIAVAFAAGRRLKGRK